MKHQAVHLEDVLTLCDSGEWGDDPVNGEGIPVLRVADVKSDNRISFGTAPIRTLSTSKRTAKTLKNGDIVVVKSSGSATNVVSGRASLVEGVEDGQFGFANFLLRLRVDERLYNPRFLIHMLGSQQVRESVLSMVSGSTYPNLKVPEYKRILIPNPPLPEQQRIVGKLDAAFAALAEAQAHVERNRANARELFESYLNRVFVADGSTTDEVRLLGEVVDFEGGSQPPKSEFIYEPRAGYIRFLQIRDFKRDDKVTFIPIAKKNRTCEESDVLIGRYGASVGNILTGRAGAYNVALVKTKPSKAITRDYLYYYLLSRLFQDALKKVADRSAQDGFSKDDIYNFPVPLPSIAEQETLCRNFNAVQRESAELETTYQQKLSELAGLKKAVLGAAFRGEL